MIAPAERLPDLDELHLQHVARQVHRYLTRKGTEVLFDSTYTTDPAQTPKQIDIVGTEGELKGKNAQGIYSLAGDTLTICYTMPGKPRPTAFESAPGSEAHLVSWKRLSSADTPAGR